MIAKVIIDTVDALIYETLLEEISFRIRELMKDKISVSEINKNIKLLKQNRYNEMHPDLHRIGISVTYDMGWQKRSTGRIYDSLSGHGFFIGCISGNIVQSGVMKKKYYSCTRSNKTSSVYESHTCSVNWTGSSGTMEAALALDLVLKL